MRNVVVLLLVGASLLATSCSTGVLIADPDRGYEQNAARYVRLRLETVRLDVVDSGPEDAQRAGALCPMSGTGDCARALQFKLPFLAFNGSDEPWPVTLGMFELERVGAVDGALVARPADRDTTVALIPPGSGARFDVFVHASGLTAKDDPLEGEYVLRVRGDGEPILIKHLSVGSFDQVSQFLRFTLGATVLLVAMAAL